MDLKIDFLDHVAIRVADLKKSAEWYEKVLNLKKYQVKEWGTFPIFLLSGKTGVALFPAGTSHKDIESNQAAIRIDHFAFHVDNQNFELAQGRFDSLNIPYKFEDHHFFHSIYLQDPDGHKVELTTLVVDEKEFY